MPARTIDSRPAHLVALRAADLADALGADLIGEDLPLTGATLDSRTVRDGDLWIALQGENNHGAEFAAGALALGAAAVLTDDAGRALVESAAASAGVRQPSILLAEDPRALAAPAAHLIYGRPSEAMTVIGVTGTNGKTSITTMIDRTLASMGIASAVVGTNGTFLTDAEGTAFTIPTVRTTPEAPELHGMLAMMRERGVQSASLEVSSHAMVLHRADAVRFAVALFTNLSQDHLDFHGTMEAYFEAKRLLFMPEHAEHGIVCVDDDWGVRLAATAGIPVTTYTTDPQREADYRITAIRPHGFGTVSTVESAGAEPFDLISALPGTHYAANSLGVALALQQTGHPFEEAAEHLGRSGQVPGRMELVEDGDIRAVVDYSHTPDALHKTLTTMRSLPSVGRVICVMGAGGERDRAKRPVMGEVSARAADMVIVTDDNPRTEDPASIRAAVLEGARAEAEHSGADVIEEGDRAAAIRRALELAQPSDVVLIAGKGAETGQDVGGRIIDFDDRAQVRAFFAQSEGAQNHA